MGCVSEPGNRHGPLHARESGIARACVWGRAYAASWQTGAEQGLTACVNIRDLCHESSEPVTGKTDELRRAMEDNLQCYRYGVLRRIVGTRTGTATGGQRCFLKRCTFGPAPQSTATLSSLVRRAQSTHMFAVL